MRSVTVRLEDLKTMILNLGYVGENEHRQIRFDAKKMYDEYPHASASLTVAPAEGESYPAVIERDGDFVIWTITDSDLTAEGDGELQLSFTYGETVAKTYIGRCRVCRSIVPTGDIPDPLDDFLTRAGAALTAIPETIDAALEEAKESGEFDGEDGVSPEVTVTTITGGHRIVISDAEGDHPFEVLDGEDGDPGHTPVITASKSGKVTTISVDGIPIATINDGLDGDPTVLIDDEAGEGDTDKVWSADKSHELLTQINSGSIEENLLRSEMPGTSTTVTMDSNGNPTSIVHTANNETVRTDSFVWSTDSVVETRTLASGKYITITTNLGTLAQTISDVQEVA